MAAALRNVATRWEDDPQTFASWLAAACEPLEPELDWESARSESIRSQIEQSSRSASRHGCVEAIPAEQPESIRELANRLFGAFQVDGGVLRLGGCQLENRPLLRLSTMDLDALPDTSVQHAWFFPDGEPVGDELVEQLGLTDLKPRGVGERASAADSARWMASCPPPGPEATWTLTTIVWCKFARGHLSATPPHGGSISIPFSGWARPLALGAIPPQPYIDSATGDASYHLVALSDGRLTADSAVGVCSKSNQRVLRTELETCPIGGQSALPEFFQDCPVSGQRLLKSTLQPCLACRESVSPDALRAGQCPACRALTPVSKDDPRLARVLAEHPQLDRWRHWQLAETATCYVLQAAALLRRLVVVVDRQTLEPRHMALCSRFGRRWQPPSELERNEWLGKR